MRCTNLRRNSADRKPQKALRAYLSSCLGCNPPPRIVRKQQIAELRIGRKDIALLLQRNIADDFSVGNDCTNQRIFSFPLPCRTDIPFGILFGIRVWNGAAQPGTIHFIAQSDQIEPIFQFPLFQFYIHLIHEKRRSPRPRSERLFCRFNYLMISRNFKTVNTMPTKP